MAIIRKIQRVRCRTVFLISGLGYIERDSGQEIAEAALVLPILFLILLAIFWFGRAFNIASTIERAAKRHPDLYSSNLRFMWQQLSDECADCR